MKNRKLKILTLMFLIAGIIIQEQKASADWVNCGTGLTGAYLTKIYSNNGFTLLAGDNMGNIYSSYSTYNQWSKIATFEGNYRVYDIEYFSGRYFAATGSFLYSSSDNGLTWIQNLVSARKLLVSSGYIYAGSSYVYKSSDGVNWVPANTGLPSVASVNGLTAIGSNIFAGLRKGGVYKSVNQGGLWTPINTGLPSDSINKLVSAGSNLFAVTPYGTYKSTDEGTSWQVVTGLPSSAISLHSTANYLFASYPGSQLLVSTDYGNVWTPAANGLQCSYINDIRNISGKFYCATASGAFYTQGLTSAWIPVFSGLNSATVTKFTDYGTGLLAGTMSGVFYSANGTSWISRNAGLTELYINNICVKGDNIYCCSIDGVFKTSDGGLNWTNVSAGQITYGVYSIHSGNNSLYAGTAYGKIYKSTNDGANWISISQGLPNFVITDIFYHNNILFASVPDSTMAYKSTNDGVNWFCIANTIPGVISGYGAGFYANGNGLYFNYMTGLAFSTNSGNNWAVLPLPYFFLYDFAVKNQNIFISSNNIYLSPDNGNAWTPVGQSLPENYNVQKLKISGNYIYAGIYGNGVWRRALNEMPIGIKSISAKVPDKYGLSQNYPNPFNLSTNIKYSVPKDGYVKLVVFDALGREVETLVSGKQSAGIYEALFDGASLTSGVYFYRLTADGFNDTKRMLLIK